jgi:hypothetical protein
MANTKTKEQFEPIELASHFFNLYRGLDRAYGSFTISGDLREDGKVNGRAKTEIGPYNLTLWMRHLAGEVGLGVVPIQEDGTCYWGSIDIDEYPLDYKLAENKIRELGLPLVCIKSKSGGLHLTMFFSEPVSCKLVREKLYNIALALGHGGVEIFPKQVMLASKKDVGNWLNMPYFNVKSNERRAIFNGEDITADQFIDLALKIRITAEQLKNIELKIGGDFEDGPPCLQMIARNGAPEGTRNNTLFAMGVYAKLKYDDDWEEKMEDMNIQFISPPLKSREVAIIIKSANKKDYFYPCNKAPLISFCNKDTCSKRAFGIGSNDQDFDLSLGSLIKIASEPPIWIIDVDGTRVQLDTEDLMIQDRFRKVCLMAINKLPPVIKRSDWEKLIREKLETVEIVEAPLESSVATRVAQYATQYLTNTPPARTIDEILLGRPYYDTNGMINFRGNDLIRYLENNGMKIEARKIWVALMEAGAEHGNIRLKSSNVQVWKLPAILIPKLDISMPVEITDSF